MRSSRRAYSLALAVIVPMVIVGATAPQASETVRVAELGRQTHIHGLAVDRQDPSRLLIATHHGLFRTGPDGRAERISEVQDFMGFNPHPTDPKALFASGHPARGGNLGFIASTDGGATWRQVAPGVKGPVDFHQMSVSAADPATIYGAYGGLQVSRDAGRTWTVVGPAPEKLIDLAASAKASDTLYAATENGLLVSRDGGKAWTPVLAGEPVSLVEVTPDGSLYAYVVGRGLMRSEGEALTFTTVSGDFGGGVLMHLAGDPADPARLFVATERSRVLTSRDWGRTWSEIGAGGS